MSLKKALDIASSVLLSISSLISSADGVQAQEDLRPQATIAESTEQKQKQHQYLQEWIESAEGEEMKADLAKAIDQLDAPEYKDRQEATKSVMQLMENLRTMIHPFPEEIIQVTGYGPIDHGYFDEHARRDLNNHYTWPESARLTEIQDLLRTKNFQTTPRIMPGAYSVQELCEALREQTGVTFLIEAEIPDQDIHITENENKWTDAVSALQKRIGGGFLHNLKNNVIVIDNNPDQYSETFVDKTCIFVHSAGEYPSTFVEKLPTTGVLIQRIASFSHPSHYIFLSPPKKLNHEAIKCDEHEWHHQLTPEKPITRMTALTLSARKKMIIPFGIDTFVGQHQIMKVTKQKSDVGFIVSIEIHRNKRCVVCTSDGDIHDVTPEMVRQNICFITDANNQTRRKDMKDADQTNMGKSWFLQFPVDTEPTTIEVSYRESGTEISIALPECCLPKDANP